MIPLVAVVHPLTGETLHLHPDVAAQTHHWIHPNPRVPTPAESLPLFEGREVDLWVAALADTQHSSANPSPVRNGSANA